MVLDGITILFDTSLLSVTVGALLVFAGTRRNGDRALTIWGAGYLIGAVGVILVALRSRLPDFWSIDIANAALILAYGAFLTGARSFAGTRTPLWQVVAGPAIWLLACRIPAFHGTPAARVILFSLMISTYVAATCVVLWRVREALPSRIPLIAVLAVHGFAFLIRAPGALLFPPPTGVNVVVTPWFVAIGIESLFHLVASSLLLVTMSKERSENGVQQLALTDPLTGLRNRRSFLESGARRLARSLRQRQPVCVLMIDIDHFKAINDQRSHDAGDEVLQSVASALTRRLRPGDLCGRLGGEEFGCLLMECDPAQGREAAERLRTSIQTELGLTVSVGVACTTDIPAAIDLRRMLVSADRALYASKDEGRNRVTLATAA